MLKIIAMLAPAIIATGFYDHLYYNKASTKKLINVFALFLVFINLLSYCSFLFLFNKKSINFTDVFFIQYLSLATGLAFALPIVASLLNLKLSVRVKKHAKKQ